MLPNKLKLFEGVHFFPVVASPHEMDPAQTNPVQLEIVVPEPSASERELLDKILAATKLPTEALLIHDTPTQSAALTIHFTDQANTYYKWEDGQLSAHSLAYLAKSTNEKAALWKALQSALNL